jgi:hypothetical protein
MLKFKGCRHVMPTGRRCQSPALRGMCYCYYHQKLQKARNASKYANKRLKLASIEDPKGVQTAIVQVCEALGKARIDSGQARVLMYGMQLATQLALHAPKIDPSEMVQDVCLAPDGTLMAADPPPSAV